MATGLSIQTDSSTISRPPSSAEYLVDRGFTALTYVSAIGPVCPVGYILWEIGIQGLRREDAIRSVGYGFAKRRRHCRLA
jgi:hypothetical protein